MKKIIDYKDCTGCSACCCICPRKCIKMARDKEGFLYPVIAEYDCVNCGLCLSICPIINCSFVEDSHIPEAFLSCAKEDNMRLAGASGGLFLAISKSFFEKYDGCFVAGAIYDSDFNVKHILIDNIEDTNLLAKSKYVQSTQNGIYISIKEKLEAGMKVLYSGTPCQVYGLKSFLKRNYDNLYCIDVVCHGVPSPLVFERYLAWQREKYGDIEEIISRDKKILCGGYVSGMRIRFSNGFQYFETNTNDYFGKCFWGEIASRPSCYNCKYKTLNHISDLTLGDCWFSEEFIGEIDSYGFTLVFKQNQKGGDLLDSVKELVDLYKIDSEAAVKANGGLLYRSAIPHPKRKDFFADIANQDMSFAEIVEKYFPSNKNNIFKQIVRSLPHIHYMWRKYSRHKDFNSRMKREIPDSARGKVIIAVREK